MSYKAYLRRLCLMVLLGVKSRFSSTPLMSAWTKREAGLSVFCTELEGKMEKDRIVQGFSSPAVCILMEILWWTLISALRKKNQHDIQKYVEEELRITGEKESEIIEFKNSLFSQTGGLFLWVILVVNRVHEMSDQGFSLRHIGSQIFKCPRELNGLYKALLESLKDEELLEAGKLFQWVRFSCRPYHLEEIRSAMTIHLDGTTKSINEFEDFKTTEYFISDEQMKKRILHLGKGLIEIADTEISQGRALVGFHHETVKDFMDTCGLQYLDSRLKEKRGLAKTADVNLANICISYLSSEDIHLASLGKSRELPSKFLFLNYAARHWLDHAVQAEVKELGSSVRWPSPQTLKTWIKVSEILDGETTEGREEGTTLMHLAADHGLLSVAKRIMGLPSKATTLDKMLRLPVAETVVLGIGCLWSLILSTIISGSSSANSSIAGLPYNVAPMARWDNTILGPWGRSPWTVLRWRRNEKQRAMVRALDARGKSAIHRAAAHGRVEMVKFLYSHEAELGGVDGDGETPMFAASYQGHLEIVKFLYAHGADADIYTPDNDHWTPIYAASWNGHLEVVKFLYAHGADSDVHVPDNINRTPIYAASDNGHLEVVKFLYAHGADTDVHTLARDRKTPISAPLNSGPLRCSNSSRLTD